MKNKKYRSSYETSSKKPAFFVVLAILVFGTLIWWFVFRSSENQTTTTTDFNESSEDISYTPPSNDEKQSGDAIKEDATSQTDKPVSNQPSDSSSTKENVNVTISNWGASGDRFEIGAGADTVDSKATCTIKLTKSSTVLTGTSNAIRQGPTSMSCGNLYVDNSKMSAGTWKATLTYSSSDSYGSITKQIKVE